MPNGDPYSLLLSICLGLGLAAACGFRVFVPFLVMGLAARADAMDLASGFTWIATDLAVATFAVASMLEIVAYFIPWVDNALDAAATPTAIVAGILASSAVVGDMHPVLQWGIGILGGAGAAGVVQTTTLIGRGVSTVSTGGLANPAYATTEAGFASGLATLSVGLPLATAIIIVALLVVVTRLIIRRRQRLQATKPASAASKVPAHQLG